MSDFLKCDCPHCGQSIEYPAEGTGQIVPCPTCEKPVTLTTAEQPQDNSDAQRKKEWDEWIALNERLNKRQIQSGVTPSEKTTPTPPPAASEAQRKKEKDEWIALHERLNERRIQSGIPLSEESTLPKAGEPQKANSRENISLPINPPNIWERGASRSRFAGLTEEMIRKKTSTGDTPLHRAAGLGKIGEIPKHLLKLELFLVKNNSNRTPIHRAARNGFLDKVPMEFLTRETMTASAEYEKKESKTGSTPPRTETPLHTAALHGHADQIPKEFLTLEFLSIEATGYRKTVLEYLFMSDSLGVITGIYSNSEMLDYKNSRGWTLRQSIEFKKQSAAAVARVRSEPATEKQKEKLRYFGCAFDENISKGQASDALDKCVRDFPEKDWAYYNRPATEEQLAKLRSRNKTLTYRQAKDLIWEREIKKRHRDQVREIEENAYQLVIMEFLRWRADHYRHLTYSRVKEAAKALDDTNPGWTKSNNCENLLLQKVSGLYPEFAAKEEWS